MIRIAHFRHVNIWSPKDGMRGDYFYGYMYPDMKDQQEKRIARN